MRGVQNCRCLPVASSRITRRSIRSMRSPGASDSLQVVRNSSEPVVTCSVDGESKVKGAVRSECMGKDYWARCPSTFVEVVVVRDGLVGW